MVTWGKTRIITILEMLRKHEKILMSDYWWVPVHRLQQFGGRTIGIYKNLNHHITYFKFKLKFSSKGHISVSYLRYVLISYDHMKSWSCWRSLGLDSASTNKSLNLYYFRFRAVKRLIQHQHDIISVYKDTRAVLWVPCGWPSLGIMPSSNSYEGEPFLCLL